MGRKSKPSQKVENYLVCPSTGTTGTDNGGHGSRRTQQGRGEKRLRRSTGGSSVVTTLGGTHMQVSNNENENENVSRNTVSKDQFKSMSTDDKLVTLFGLMGHVHDIATRVEKTDRNVNIQRRCIDENTRRIKILEYKSIDIEARSRRNNAVIRGIPESLDENCDSKVLSFINENLQLDRTKYTIQRAHRIGRRVQGSDRPRPLIVCFRDFANVTELFQYAHRLRNTRLSISRDYPAEITAARSKLWPLFKEAKRTNPRGSVKLVYPAKLIVNGRVTHDEFPDWADVMSGHRSGLINVERKSLDNTSSTHHEQSALEPIPMEDGIQQDSDSNSDDETTDAGEPISAWRYTGRRPE